MDVDGVLNPFPKTPEGFSEFEFFPQDDEPVRLCATHGKWLKELGETFEIVWASGWGEAANQFICPTFGLSTFPVVPLPPVPFDPREKVPAVAAFVGDRPAAWVDDIVTGDASTWAAARTAPTLLIEVDAAVGFAINCVDELRAWAAALSASP